MNKRNVVILQLGLIGLLVSLLCISPIYYALGLIPFGVFQLAIGVFDLTQLKAISQTHQRLLYTYWSLVVTFSIVCFCVGYGSQAMVYLIDLGVWVPAMLQVIGGIHLFNQVHRKNAINNLT